MDDTGGDVMSISFWQDDTQPGDVVTADVIIVGAGISGASAAWWLKDAGLKVVVLDKGAICAGATGDTPRCSF